MFTKIKQHASTLMAGAMALLTGATVNASGQVILSSQEVADSGGAALNAASSLLTIVQQYLLYFVSIAVIFMVARWLKKNIGNLGMRRRGA